MRRAVIKSTRLNLSVTVMLTRHHGFGDYSLTSKSKKGNFSTLGEMDRKVCFVASTNELRYNPRSPLGITNNGSDNDRPTICDENARGNV